MDLKIFKINNGYKIGRKDCERLGANYGRRYYITKRPMRRDPAKKLLMKLQLAEQGIRMKVKSLKKPRYDGFVKIDPKLSKKKNNFQDEPDEEFRHLIIYL
jgi:hypothetical protein|tara:strand:- start:10188 stop:10490 length:303 start_codon:yes stop_codon:yes gene_type:complete